MKPDAFTDPDNPAMLLPGLLDWLAECRKPLQAEWAILCRSLADIQSGRCSRFRKIESDTNYCIDTYDVVFAIEYAWTTSVYRLTGLQRKALVLKHDDNDRYLLSCYVPGIGLFMRE